MTRCHMCKRPCVRQVEPACGALAAVIERDVWTVALGSGIYVDACHGCWMKWPWEYRLYPETGFGRGEVAHDEFVALLGGRA